MYVCIYIYIYIYIYTYIHKQICICICICIYITSKIIHLHIYLQKVYSFLGFLWAQLIAAMSLLSSATPINCFLKSYLKIYDKNINYVRYFIIFRK